jgi:hypothetical protein
MAASWRSKHSGWELRIVDECEIATNLGSQFVMPGGVNDPKVRIALLRYAALYEFGGISLASPLHCLRCVEPLLSMVSTQTFAGLATGSSRYLARVGDALVGALPGSTFIGALLEEVIRLYSGSGGENVVPSSTFNIDILTQMSDASSEITVFPRHIFYPSEHEHTVAFAALSLQDNTVPR